MDVARHELGRITAARNPYSFSVGDKNDDVDGHRYYFFDQHGVCPQTGDHSLHRLLAMHTPPQTLSNFLLHAKTHHQRLQQKSEDTTEATNMIFEEHDMNMMSISTMTSTQSQDPYKKLPAPLPNIVCQANHQGVTSLHVAVHRNSFHVDQIVAILLEACPGLAFMPMKTGSLPLHIATGHNMTVHCRMLNFLLRANPLAVLTEDVHGDNPVSLLWKNVLRFRWARTWECQGTAPPSLAGDMSWLAIITPFQFRDYCLGMMQAARDAMTNHTSCQGAYVDAVHNTPSSTLSWHDVCAFPRCPPLLVRMLLLESLYVNKGDLSHMLMQADATTFRLPLHEAAAARVVSWDFVKPWSKEEEHGQGSNDGRRSSQTTGTSTVLELILHAAPQAATVADGSGRFPLHYAVTTNTPSRALWSLAVACPDALRARDPSTGLFPAQTVATTNTTPSEEGDAARLDIVYKMLRSCPEVVSVH